MAILWHEMWHEALEEASRQYFGESNVEAMLNTLMPLHEMMNTNGPTTLKEIAFVQVSAPCCMCSLDGKRFQHVGQGEGHLRCPAVKLTPHVWGASVVSRMAMCSVCC